MNLKYDESVIFKELENSKWWNGYMAKLGYGYQNYMVAVAFDDMTVTIAYETLEEAYANYLTKQEAVKKGYCLVKIIKIN